MQLASTLPRVGWTAVEYQVLETAEVADVCAHLCELRPGFLNARNRGGPTPPDAAFVLSPFFDRPEETNAPAIELWQLLRRRGEASVEYHVAAEGMPGEDALCLYAPKSLLDAEPKGRSNVATNFYRVLLAGDRSLHAKGSGSKASDGVFIRLVPATPRVPE